MPIISKVGRTTAAGRLMIGSLYTVLIGGALTMVYPFLLMASSSLCNAYDADRFDLIPAYLVNSDELAKKYLFYKYGRTRLEDLAGAYDADERWMNWNDILDHEDFVNDVYGDSGGGNAAADAATQRRINDWYAFKKSLDPSMCALYFLPDPGRPYEPYSQFLRQRYMDGDDEPGRDAAALEQLNQRHSRSYRSFAEIVPPVSFFYHQRWFPPEDRAHMADWIAFKAEQPPASIAVVTGRQLWKRYLRRQFVSIADFNQATGLTVQRFADVPFPVTSDMTRLQDVWKHFLRTRYPLRLIELNPKAQQLWRPYLEQRFSTADRYNTLMKADVASLDDVPFHTQARQVVGRDRLLWIDFVRAAVPVELWELNTSEQQFSRFIEHRYGEIDRLNAAYGSRHVSFTDVPIPRRLADLTEVSADRNALRWRFATWNYRKVIDFLVNKERALLNTIILVALAVLAALTVNPLAAYVLSRCDARISHKVLIFFLATMAFPAEVAMIPGFLLLRDLGMLNTFAALVIPGMANGFAIFLLKGFFDSIPSELYEAATIDGARESQMFLYITYPMCKPILAVIALGAFTAAYGGFMWAFLVCQDSQMWTLMVWLYIFQTGGAADTGMVMASLALASIPMLLVFLFCQNIIMRGIIIPTMK